MRAIVQVRERDANMHTKVMAGRCYRLLDPPAVGCVRIHMLKVSMSTAGTHHVRLAEAEVLADEHAGWGM